MSDKKPETRRIKILRRVADGKEFNYDPMMDTLVKKGLLRLIEFQVDAKTGKKIDEIDLTRLDDDNSDKALRDAIGVKWPHLVPLIDRPELARMAVKTADGTDEPSEILSLAGVEPAGEGLPPEDEDEDTPPAPKTKKAAKAAKTAKTEAPKTEDTPVDPIEAKVAEFSEAMRQQPGRAGKKAFAAENGIEIEDAAAGAMVAEAVALYTAKLKAEATPKA